MGVIGEERFAYRELCDICFEFFGKNFEKWEGFIDKIFLLI
jgi:hypothetical protein